MSPTLHSIQPQWVLFDNQVHHVSDFADLSSNRRPTVYCLVCGNPVILKLGQQRIHHYAHAADIVCPVTQPETALHLNLKYHLYNQLKQTNVLNVERRCAGGCGEKHPFLWLADWDEVRVEQPIGPFRADVALLSNGEVVAAIEVRVTHKVDAEKAQYFTYERLHWLEISATESLYEGGDAWQAVQPLPWSEISPFPDALTCQECLARQQRNRQEREYREKNYVILHAAKMIDFYFPSGKKYREILYLMKQVTNGEWVKAWVKTREKVTVATVKGQPVTEETLFQLNQKVSEYLETRKNTPPRTIMDTVIPWRKWEPGSKFVPQDFDRYPYKYYWDSETKKWLPEK